jgi:Bacteriophage tail sheath protein
MPEYLAPGVYVEEISTGARPIQGVGTSTAGFVGAASSGALDAAVGPIASFTEFAQQFGDGSAMEYRGSPAMPAFLWHAARAFFLEGGKRLWVVRVSHKRTNGERARPRAQDFERGIALLEAIDEVAMIAAPGSTFDAAGDFHADALAISAALIGRSERMRYRIAVIDAPDAQSVAQVHAWRSRFTSSFGALYFPWLKAAGPSGGELLLPPSGFVTGIYARSDMEGGVHKSPTNEIVRSVLGLEVAIDDAQAAALDAEGINCIREFAGQGVRVWGGRTLSADSAWKYVNVRRYVAYLEKSIDRGVQWAVFEPNGEVLWQNIRRTVSDFLFNEWRTGALPATKPEEAFFAKCDCSTMTQEDIDEGRVIVLVGVAPLKPAEFVMLRVVVQLACRSGPGSAHTFRPPAK